MENRKVKITGILLAGGMSSRMGSEKGRMKLGNRNLYEYPLQVLEACCDEILISTCNDSVIPAAYHRVCDEFRGIGPMGGIYTCLKYSSNDLNVILSYDMPGVTVSLIKHLLKEVEAFDIVVPAQNPKQVEPLCGIYRKNALAVFESCIQRNEFAVHKVLKLSKSKIVRIDRHMSCWNPHLFININRVEDLESLPSDFGNALNEN